MHTEKNSFLHLVDRWLESISNVLGISVFIVMVVSVWLGVLYRYVLVNPLTWTDELAVYGMIWLGYLGMGIAVKYNEHPSLNFFVDRMPSLLQKICKLIANFGVLVFLLVAVIWGFDYAINSGKYRMTGALGITMTLPQLSVPVGSLLALCQLFLRWIRARTNSAEPGNRG
jgi:TRAP-type C4-dicarboxylate transport system permease small subunit